MCCAVATQQFVFICAFFIVGEYSISFRMYEDERSEFERAKQQPLPIFEYETKQQKVATRPNNRLRF